MQSSVNNADHSFFIRPHCTLLSLALPVLLSLMAEPITGLVDTAFVARLGAAPLAAIGVGTMALSGIYWIFYFLGIGSQTEISHALGRRDQSQAAVWAAWRPERYWPWYGVRPAIGGQPFRP